jgi:Mn-dependent DtxR family transcriptional regulator
MLARTSDPSTSHEAAKFAVAKMSSQKARIYGALRDHGAMTSCEIASHSDLSPHQVQKRLSEMERLGYVELTGNERPGWANVPMREWRAVVRGK